MAAAGQATEASELGATAAEDGLMDANHPEADRSASMPEEEDFEVEAHDDCEEAVPMESQPRPGSRRWERQRMRLPEEFRGFMAKRRGVAEVKLPSLPAEPLRDILQVPRRRATGRMREPEEWKGYTMPGGGTIRIPLDGPVQLEEFEALSPKTKYSLLQRAQEAWFGESRLKAVEAKDDMGTFCNVQLEMFLRHVRTNKELEKVKRDMAQEVVRGTEGEIMEGDVYTPPSFLHRTGTSSSSTAPAPAQETHPEAVREDKQPRPARRRNRGRGARQIDGALLPQLPAVVSTGVEELLSGDVIETPQQPIKQESPSKPRVRQFGASSLQISDLLGESDDDDHGADARSSSGFPFSEKEEKLQTPSAAPKPVQPLVNSDLPHRSSNMADACLDRAARDRGGGDFNAMEVAAELAVQSGAGALNKNEAEAEEESDIDGVVWEEVTMHSAPCTEEVQHDKEAWAHSPPLRCDNTELLVELEAQPEAAMEVEGTRALSLAVQAPLSACASVEASVALNVLSNQASLEVAPAPPAKKLASIAASPPPLAAKQPHNEPEVFATNLPAMKRSRLRSFFKAFTATSGHHTKRAAGGDKELRPGKTNRRQVATKASKRPKRVGKQKPAQPSQSRSVEATVAAARASKPAAAPATTGLVEPNPGTEALDRTWCATHFQYRWRCKQDGVEASCGCSNDNAAGKKATSATGSQARRSKSSVEGRVGDLNETDLEELEFQRMEAELEDEREELKAQVRKAKRGADTPTPEMQADVERLLEAFGIPVVHAPAEAEAQCVFLAEARLVDAVATDDSDALVFGATEVYRRLFSEDQLVECYSSDKIEAKLGLQRAEMAILAMLLGCDYTVGVHGIGIVNGLEVVRAFAPGVRNQPHADRERPDRYAERQWIEELKKFQTWAQNGWDGEMDGVEPGDTKAMASFKRTHKNFRTQWSFPSDFPNLEVVEAFLRPDVDRNADPFAWAAVDEKRVTALLLEASRGRDGHAASGPDMLSEDKIRERLEPALKRYCDTLRQPRITEYMRPVGVGDVAIVRSDRMREALRGLRGEEPPDEQSTSPKPKRQGRKRAESKAASSKAPKKAARKSGSAAGWVALKSSEGQAIDLDDEDIL